MEKNIARIQILNYIVTRCKSINYGDGKNLGGFNNNYFFPNYPSGEPPIPGDLVCLTSASPSEWYLSWYLELIPQSDYYSNIHVLESIETGKVCNWRNVGFDILCRDVVKQYPEWRWTDKQYAFKDRWFRACYKKRAAFMTLPKSPIFHDGGGVTIGTRKRHGLGGEFNLKFPNWKKVLVKDMLEFYDSVSGD